MVSPGWRETDGATRLSRLSSPSSLHDFFCFQLQMKIVSNTTIYRIGTQQGPAVQHKEFTQYSLITHMGKDLKKNGYMYN